jgi:hypothetical protein
MPTPVHDGSISARAWAWWLLGALAAATAAIVAFNAAVDPTAQLGSGIVGEPVAAGPRDRVAKVALLEESSPRLVVLGSSRTKKLDPAWLGDDGMNAAVVGGDAFEARVLAAWLAERSRAADEPFPQLVVGVDVEQLRDSSLQGSGFLDVPELAPVARREAAGADGSIAGELDRLERLLLTWQVTKASAASLRARLRSGASDVGEAEEVAAIDEFTTTGVPTDDARWADPDAAERRARATPAAIERNLRELRGTYEANGARLDPDAVADLRALVRIARDAGGPTPLLYLTPAHPRTVEELGNDGRDERRDAIWVLLRGFERNDLATVVDCTTCIDDSDTSWIDATHPSPLGMRQLAARLAIELDQAPSATPTERSGASR